MEYTNNDCTMREHCVQQILIEIVVPPSNSKTVGTIFG